MSTFGDYWQEKTKPQFERLGLTLDELSEAVPLRHYGPGGCDGVDLEETYEQILSLAEKLVEAERKRCALPNSEAK